MMLRVQPVNRGVRIGVRVQLRASRNAVVGPHGDELKVRIAAPAVRGAANDALIELLATTFGMGRRDVRIVSGTRSRSKMVEIVGIDEAHARHSTDS